MAAACRACLACAAHGVALSGRAVPCADRLLRALLVRACPPIKVNTLVLRIASYFYPWSSSFNSPRDHGPATPQSALCTRLLVGKARVDGSRTVLFYAFPVPPASAGVRRTAQSNDVGRG